MPSETPSSTPSAIPSTVPSEIPSSQPSSGPSMMPSATPSSQPSSRPSMMPSSKPSMTPSSWPSMMPSETPSSMPNNSGCDAGEAAQYYRFRPDTWTTTCCCELRFNELFMYEDASCTGPKLLGTSYSASSVMSPSNPGWAFDGDVNTVFNSAQLGCSVEHWLEVDFGVPTTVGCVRLLQPGTQQDISTLIVESRADSSSAWAPVNGMSPAALDADNDTTIDLCQGDS